MIPYGLPITTLSVRGALRVVATLLLMICTAGCNQKELLNGLTSKQSIEVLDRLFRSGISAEREQVSSGRRASYRILVPEGDFSNAVVTLKAHGLPRETAPELETFTQQRGFIPNSPEIAALRFDMALSKQVERMVLLLPGIIEVAALIRSKREGQEPSATLAVRYVAPSGKQPFSDAELKGIAAQVLPGLSSESVKLSSTRVLLPSSDTEVTAPGVRRFAPFRFRVPQEDAQVARVELLITFLLVAFCGMILGSVGGRLLAFGKRSSLPREPGRK